MLVEEKYGKNSTTLPRMNHEKLRKDESVDSGSSTDSEEEDDDGFLASGVLDEQVNATLQAIRARDPRVYDETTTFYTSIENGDGENNSEINRSEKPMYLSDYHRETLLRGDIGVDEEEDAVGLTYVQQQADLKRVIVKEMHDAANSSSGEDKIEDNEFLVLKKPTTLGDSSEEYSKKPILVDVRTADNEPETFLSNFLSARAWVPSAGSQFQPFESDDEEEDDRAEAFEAAYNLRFEDPKGSNEKLMSHARDTAAKYSVRRETINSRKKARETERAKKDAEKRERDEEKARLRKLKIDEAGQKLRKIREAAGLGGKVLELQEWTAFLEEGWDDRRWDVEMTKRFGDDYYADEDIGSAAEEESSKKKKKGRKPKWKDEIDIKDLVPDFNDGEFEKPPFALSDASDGEDIMDKSITNGIVSKSKDKKSLKRLKNSQKLASRAERHHIESLVDAKLTIDHALSTVPNASKSQPTTFRYRATSPLAYGLTARDILMASDSQLNQYVGLKKMAAFRDQEKKKRDRKRLGKKARLREWRKECFGSEDGPRTEVGSVLAAPGVDMKENSKKSNIDAADMEEQVAVEDRKKMRKRARKNKNVGVDTA